MNLKMNKMGTLIKFKWLRDYSRSSIADLKFLKTLNLSRRKLLNPLRMRRRCGSEVIPDDLDLIVTIYCSHHCLASSDTDALTYLIENIQSHLFKEN